EASSFFDQSGIETENCSEGGLDVAFIENGDYVGYKDVDFGTGANAIDIRVAANSGGGTIELHLDGPTGKLIGTLDVEPTGGWQDWATQRASLTETSGKHDLYMVFKGGEGYLFNVAAFKLNVPGGTSVTKDYILGDLNDDKKVDARDLTELKKAVKAGTIDELDPADLDGDLDLTAEDAKLLRDYLTGKIESFPAAE
ncbi:MAG: carbohydrate-binding protein, partial [Oscillospiraceae bacterium]|nr:carbohydrate-binding protein [Oscillospiraceae bacterium]